MGKIRKPKPTRAKKSAPVIEVNDEEELPVDSKENAIQTILDQMQVSFVNCMISCNLLYRNRYMTLHILYNAIRF